MTLGLKNRHCERRAGTGRDRYSPEGLKKGKEERKIKLEDDAQWSTDAANGNWRRYGMSDNYIIYGRTEKCGGRNKFAIRTVCPHIYCLKFRAFRGYNRSSKFI